MILDAFYTAFSLNVLSTLVTSLSCGTMIAVTSGGCPGSFTGGAIQTESCFFLTSARDLIQTWIFEHQMSELEMFSLPFMALLCISFLNSGLNNQSEYTDLPNTNNSAAESSSISFSLLSPVVSSHVISRSPMTFTARQPSVLEHSIRHLELDDVITILMTLFLSLLFGYGKYSSLSRTT